MLDFGQIERHHLFSSFPFSFFIWLLGSRVVYLDLSPDPPIQTTRPTLATIDDRVPSSEFETGGSIGRSSHEKPNPTNPTHLHLSQTQIRWDLARFKEISTRSFWDSAKFQRDLPRSDQISTRSCWDSTNSHRCCCSIGFDQNRSCPLKTKLNQTMVSNGRQRIKLLVTWSGRVDFKFGTNST